MHRKANSRIIIVISNATVCQIHLYMQHCYMLHMEPIAIGQQRSDCCPSRRSNSVISALGAAAGRRTEFTAAVPQNSEFGPQGSQCMHRLAQTAVVSLIRRMMTNRPNGCPNGCRNIQISFYTYHVYHKYTLKYWSVFSVTLLPKFCRPGRVRSRFCNCLACILCCRAHLWLHRQQALLARQQALLLLAS